MKRFKEKCDSSKVVISMCILFERMIRMCGLELGYKFDFLRAL